MSDYGQMSAEELLVKLNLVATDLEADVLEALQIRAGFAWKCTRCTWVMPEDHQTCARCGRSWQRATIDNGCTCDGRGWIVSERDDGRRAVERCDACAILNTDEEAARIATPTIRCSPSYPCVLDEPTEARRGAAPPSDRREAGLAAVG